MITDEDVERAQAWVDNMFAGLRAEVATWEPLPMPQDYAPEPVRAPTTHYVNGGVVPGPRLVEVW